MTQLDSDFRRTALEHATVIHSRIGQDLYIELLKQIPDQFFLSSYREQAAGWQRMRAALREGIWEPERISLRAIIHDDSIAQGESR